MPEMVTHMDLTDLAGSVNEISTRRIWISIPRSAVSLGREWTFKGPQPTRQVDFSATSTTFEWDTESIPEFALGEVVRLCLVTSFPEESSGAELLFLIKKAEEDTDQGSESND